MTSINKKHKAKNSYIYNGGEKASPGKGKRWKYFTKWNRLQNKLQSKKMTEEQ